MTVNEKRIKFLVDYAGFLCAETNKGEENYANGIRHAITCISYLVIGKEEEGSLSVAKVQEFITEAHSDWEEESDAYDCIYKMPDKYRGTKFLRTIVGEFYIDDDSDDDNT